LRVEVEERDDEIARNARRPEGLRRHGPISVLAASSAMKEHRLRASPPVWADGARNNSVAISNSGH